MNRLACCVAAIVLTNSGCGDRVPLVPTSPQPSPEVAAEFATLNGRVYARVDWGDPLLADVIVGIKGADGSDTSTVSDADGFYEVVVRPGAISITASKEGYETKTWELTLLKDTVLNFGLTPK